MTAALALGVVVFEPGAAAAPPRPEGGARTRLGPLADRPRGGGKPALRLKPPTVRIGLSADGKTLSLGSAGGLYIVDRDTGRDAWKHIHKGTVRFVLERSGEPEPSSVYRVQVASLADQQEAEALKERLETETGEAAQVSRYPDRNAWRVRVGMRASREEIRQVEEKLRATGFSEIWVVQEPGPSGRVPRIRLVDEDFNDLVTSSRAMLVLPVAEGRPVRLAEIPYRGVIEVLLTGGRELQAVNLINMEEYLRGVVPKELGPSVFSELEALKAQAVAARTYMVANRGQFSEDGYDICDTARCQVYGGIAAEHPLSDFAVEQTAGVVATYEGKPINALYTSTCGGHTEDVKNVFREMGGPYLKGVECYPDEEVLGAARRTLAGAPAGPPVTLPGGEKLDEAVAILEVNGVLSPEQSSAEYLSGYPTASDVGSWTQAALRVIGKRPPASFEAAREVRDTAALAEYLVEALDWGDRLDLILDSRDLPAFLGEAILAAVPEKARFALAYMVKEEILPRPRVSPGGETGTPLQDPVSRAGLARALYQLVMKYEANGLRAAKYLGSRSEAIGLRSEGTLAFHPVAPRLHLVHRGRAGATRLAELVLQGGDNLEYHLAADGSVDLIAVNHAQRGASDDRFSNVYSWETRLSREELETRIRARASIGKLVDLVPGRRGASGRIVDLNVVGSAGRVSFHGFNIERLLGLRETLFLVDRQYGDDGAVETFIFSGKGWGHGVGMCQVGAYGMALRGRTYQEILHHYYTGVTLQTLESMGNVGGMGSAGSVGAVESPQGMENN